MPSLLTLPTVRPSCSIGELVKDGQNGRTFKTAKELFALLSVSHLIPSETTASSRAYRCAYGQVLLAGFPNNETTELDSLRNGIKTARYGGAGVEEAWGSWDENWDRVVLPLLSGSSSSKRD